MWKLSCNSGFALGVERSRSRRTLNAQRASPPVNRNRWNERTKKMKQTIGMVGRKIGMTRIFTDDGAAVPVTVLDVANNRVTQITTPENDGYASVQVTYGKSRPSRVNKTSADQLT